jgi:hypothetical protein
MTSTLEMATVQEKANVRTVVFFSRRSLLSKTHRRHRTLYGKDPPSGNSIRVG